jgi:membrane associated rhomboid family serine protease
MVFVFGDNLHRKQMSVATHGIAAACVAVTVAEIALPQATIGIDRLFAFVPIEFSLHPAASLYTLVTAEFLHSGIFHLVGNLVFLIAFGRSIENLVGSKMFIAAFVGLGALSFLGSWLLNPASPIPIIGASGALSFLMGAYTVIFPRAKLRIIPFLRVPYVRAWLFSATWIAFQILDGSFVGETLGGVAYATHFGGFIVGLVAGITWKEFALDTDRLIAELTDEASL